MSELRQDPTTKEWVIMAPERGKRPQQTLGKRITDQILEWDASCPFCPRNEAQTPAELFRIPTASHNSDWQIRVIPNRFAALSPEGSTARRESGYFARSMDGFGVHEVIIESHLHNATLPLMPYEQVENVLIAYQQRYNSLKMNRQLKFITIFKNHGRESGTTMAHPHSQLVATPIITPYYHKRFDVAHDYHADMGTCLYCDIIQEEMEKGERIVAVTDEFIVFQPFASRMPWETWIVPKRHRASFGLLPAINLPELAKVLKHVLLCLYHELDSPAYNLMIDTTTTEDEEDPYYHWHIRIMPRQSMIAGFEIGSGIYITSALPEETAGRMRQCIG
ncbi:MAG: galactose-1-phosphate uridylyltransferase [Dehalococcoidales bacterium]|nr:galactose-1-phosphate uridylyltransferase [Dehalococcoidales bacterium]